MSSPKSLVLQLRQSDRNRVLTGKYGDLNPEGKKFLQIYVHCDCDPEVIVDSNWTYDEALDFIMEGDRSNLCENVAYCNKEHYISLGHTEAEEPWSQNMPEATDDPYPLDYGSVLMITRTDDPNEEITVLEWDDREGEYVIFG